ncbi:MAG: carbon monoxide dehydrogenase [SAR202 cluster bacterium Io17-Chloro-G9]|nr:MAG: carbon monoxide dehydrogenase [SAR202 cluster bacterium Io17-Chloro-G9]
MTTRIFGSGIRRREDPRLITGQATYTDDVKLTGMLYAAILRSPHAHANINSIDVSAARSMPGVVAAYTGADTDGVLSPIPCAWIVPDSDVKAVAYPAMAKDVVRYAGEAVAVVVAESRAQAEDALEAIDANYQILPSVTNPEAATQEGAPQLHEDAPGNQAFHWVVAGGDADAAFQSPEVLIKDTILQQRLIPTAMETRSAVASYASAMGELTLWNTTQNPHIVRFLCSLVTGLGEHKIRVIAPEVGGGFGSKVAMYPSDMIAVFCSMRLGRPVKWTESRTENFQATIHGRDHIQHVELAATREGKITGLRTTVYAGMGAYLSTASTGIPTILHGLMYSGPYDIPNIKGDIYGVFTNTTPVDAYRGAGRPEATFLLERLVELLADELGQDPVEIRRLNLIPKFDDGHDVATGLTYDSGDYQLALDTALNHVDYQELRKEQAHQREHGHYIGIGVTCYCEICGLGPSQVAGAVGFGGGLWESAIVRFYATGKVNVFVGTSPHGQGEETTFAQVVSDELGVPVEDIEIIHGDTDVTPMGWGTYGSRTTVVGGAAVALSSRKIKEKGRALAAHLLEAAEEDIDYEDGKFFVRGSPDQNKTIQDIALMANVAWNMPEGMEPGLEATTFYDPPNFAYPFGTHVAVVSVDPDNGYIELQRYVAVDDCGPQINPVIVEGQVQGGVVQGAGQALWEGVVYDDNGQLLTGSLLDYTLPRAHMLPDIEIINTVTPSPHNPLGVKGIGETGTIASTVTIYNAVMDALKPLGVTKLDMPLTPETVWQAIHQTGGHTRHEPTGGHTHEHPH